MPGSGSPDATPVKVTGNASHEAAPAGTAFTRATANVSSDAAGAVPARVSVKVSGEVSSEPAGAVPARVPAKVSREVSSEPAGAAPARVPAWKAALNPVAGFGSTPAVSGARVTAPHAARNTTPLALLFELREPSHRQRGPWRSTAPTTVAAEKGRTSDLRLAVRPAIRSAAGRWVIGNVTWGSLVHQVHRLELDQRQVDWFGQFAALGRSASGVYLGQDPDRLLLDDFASPLLWELFAEAQRLGIVLVSGRKGGLIRLGRGARIGLDVAAVPDRSVHGSGPDPSTSGPDRPDGGLSEGARSEAGLSVEVAVDIDGRRVPAGSVGMLGTHGLYAVEWDPELTVTLAPSDTLLGSELAGLLARERLVVPAADAEEFLTTYYPALDRRLGVSSTDGSVALPEIPPLVRPGHRELTEPPTLTVTTVETDQRDWFDLGILVRVGEYRVPFGPLFAALSKGEPTLTLVDGSRLSLRQPLFDRLRDLIAEAGELAEWETGPRISRYQAALWAEFEDLADVSEPARSWRESVGGLLRLIEAADAGAGAAADRDVAQSSVPESPATGAGATGSDATEPGVADTDAAQARAVADPGAAQRGPVADRVALPDGLRAELRPYQLAGFQWLAFLHRHDLGGILADDMGLGKTVQTLTLIAHAVEERSASAAARHPFLVVAPTSVVANWVSEAARFTPGLRVVPVTATRSSSTGLPDAAREASWDDADIVVTSYTLFRLGFEAYRSRAWAGLILDEAQFVKNHASRAHRCARELSVPFKLAITGTPMENNLLELWSMFDIVAPGLFPSRRRFLEEYVRPVEHSRSRGDSARVIARLRRRARPLLLRRTKEAVAPELPPKQEQVLRVELTPAHRRLYDAFLQKERQKLLGLIEDLDRNRFTVFRSLTLLRLLSIDAALIDERYSGVASAKIDLLLEQLDEALAEGHRALIFSQFTSFLGRVAARLEARGVGFAYLDGKTTRRSDAVASFRSGEVPLFLISLKAGGFGLNLTEADYVFLLDPWWNPAAEAQAVDRAHRIGQDKHVVVYRLVSADTIEEKVLALGERKARLFDAVLDDDGTFTAALSGEDIRALLDG